MPSATALVKQNSLALRRIDNTFILLKFRKGSIIYVMNKAFTADEKQQPNSYEQATEEMTQCTGGTSSILSN
jgi:hypothetical protein